MTCACHSETNQSIPAMIHRLTSSYADLQVEVIEMRDELAKQKHRVQCQEQIIASFLDEIKRCAT